MIPFNTKEALKSGVYASGTTGTGKSDVLMYIAEILMKLGIIVIVFDTSQDWQERSSIPHVYPSTLATSYQEKSVIFDFSHLTPKVQQRVVEDFCMKLMRHQAETPKKERKQYFIIFEEAHTYFPQGCMMAKRYQNTVKMMTQGRNFKVRFACITQFAAMIDKNAMRYMKQRYFGATDEPNDVEYIQRFFHKKNRNQIGLRLRILKAGQFIYRYRDTQATIQIEPFTTTQKPEQLPQPKLRPLPEITKPNQKLTSDTKAWISLGTALLFLLAIIIIAS